MRRLLKRPCDWLRVFWASALIAVALPAQAGLNYCGVLSEPDAGVQQRQLRLSALVRAELDRRGQRLALVARDGTDLSRWRIRYSHAGLMLRTHPQEPWTVRQLYYDCEQGQPRIFDQGLAGFIHGARHPDQGFLSLLFLPDDAAHALADAALDDAQALALLHPKYSANAHAFSTRFQNCNQWLVELMAVAWGRVQGREAAQQWLAHAGYAGQTVDLGPAGGLWMALATFSPWLHLGDHPEADRRQALLRISLPEAIMDWLQQRYPEAQRLQLCHVGDRVVLREGSAPWTEGCVAGPDDTVRSLSDAHAAPKPE